MICRVAFGDHDIKDEKKEEDKKYSHKEYSYASFERRFTLPENVDLKKVDANYEDGILHILLPKKEVSKEENSYEITIK
jgi:HSP20 family protein